MSAAVKTTITELPESRVRVEAEVTPDEIERSVQRTAAAMGRDLRMPGFDGLKFQDEVAKRRVICRSSSSPVTAMSRPA